MKENLIYDLEMLEVSSNQIIEEKQTNMSYIQLALHFLSKTLFNLMSNNAAPKLVRKAAELYNKLLEYHNKLLSQKSLDGKGESAISPQSLAPFKTNNRRILYLLQQAKISTQEPQIVPTEEELRQWELESIKEKSNKTKEKIVPIESIQTTNEQILGLLKQLGIELGKAT